MKPFLILLFVLVASQALFAKDVSFQQISPDGGIVVGGINDIIQDKYGYTWAATSQGLIKYSSAGYEIYRSLADDTLSLASDDINGFFIDKNQRLWIGTSLGICCYNPDENNFNRFRYVLPDHSLPNHNVRQILIDSENNLWIISRHGLGIININQKVYYPVSFPDGEIPNIICKDKEGILWIGSVEGSLFTINNSTLEVQLVIKGLGSKINSICEANELLWIGTEKNSLECINKSGNIVAHPSFNKVIPKNETIRKIIQSHDGRLWIGTYHGLFIYQDGNVSHYDSRNNNLPHTSIYALYEDPNSGIWIGTWSGGISYYSQFKNQFTNYRHTNSATSLSNNIVSSFAENQYQQLYVGTEVGGINFFNREDKTFKIIPLDKNLSEANIKCQTFDKFGGHWVGTNKNGLWYKAPGRLYFQHFAKGVNDGNHVSFDEIYDLQATDTGIWIATHGRGVNFYNFASGKIEFVSISFAEKHPNNNYVRTLFVDKHSQLYLGTLNGAFVINLKQNELKADKIINDYIYSIFQKSDDEIWFGTRSNAIYIYNTKQNKVTHFNANELLEGRDVYGIIEDETGKQWITSNNGLICYNSSNNQAKRYTFDDGIQGALFSANSVFKDNNGFLYLGGTNGFTVFNPEGIKQNNIPPKVTVSTVTVNNKKTLFLNCLDEKTITLEPDENTLRINFVSNNYLSSQKNRYHYRLTNYLNEWQDYGSETSLLFANLPWGKYTFEVKTANNDGVWSSESARLNIIISKPFFASNLALIIYFLLVGFVIFMIVRTAKRRAAARAEIERERMRHKQEEQIHELKLRLFTNISHEFRTPLSLITGPSKQLKSDSSLSWSQKSSADIIYRNSQRMLNLINQIINVQKIDKGVEELELVNNNIVSFIHECCKNFNLKAEEEQIKYEFKSDFDVLNIDYDEKKIDFIITNLVSNAFKYTPKFGAINVKISDTPSISSDYSNSFSFGNSPEGERIIISVSDTGPGIPASELASVFERFKQGKEHKSGSGIGLHLCKQYTLLLHGCIKVQSTKDRGSCFTIEIPTIQSGSRVLQTNDNIPGEVLETVSVNSHVAFLNRADKESQFSILIVEDNIDLAHYISNLLKAQNFKTEISQNGENALTLLLKDTFDLIISDVMMPEMDGFEFCSRVKSDIAISHIPVILLTALSTTQNKVTGLSKGADAYITKPFEDEILLSYIYNLLSQRQQLHEYFLSQNNEVPNSQLNGLDNYFLSKVNAVIENNMDNEELDVEMMMQEVGFSRSQLHRKLKQITNHSVTEYIRNYRLKRAIELMKTNEFNIDEISFKVGFNTHSYFTRCFKKKYGVSPKEYIKLKL